MPLRDSWGDDKRIIIRIHGLSDILLNAVPENLGIKKHKQKKKVHFTIDGLHASKQALAEIADVDKHKLNGWVNLWGCQWAKRKYSISEYIICYSWYCIICNYYVMVLLQTKNYMN